MKILHHLRNEAVQVGPYHIRICKFLKRHLELCLYKQQMSQKITDLSSQNMIRFAGLTSSEFGNNSKLPIEWYF